MLAKALLPRFCVCLWTIFVSFCGVVSPIWAQEPTPDPKAPLKMALSSPFALTAKPLSLLAKRGKWFPVAITLSNLGDPVQGEAHLKLLGSGDAPANDFSTPVDLPTNARKVVWLYGRLERQNVAAIEVSFRGRGFETLTERVPIDEPNEGQRVILTVSDVDSGLSAALRGLRGSGLSLSGASNSTIFNPNAAQNPLRPLETGRDGVPDRWVGMDIADLVILGDFPHTALAPPQLEALRGYVAGGGTLLALGGANTPRLASSPLADLWPATLGGSATASAEETRQIVARYVETRRPLTGADKLGGSSLVTARGAAKPGAQVRLGTPTQPLFTTQNSGAGRVVLLGFDPSQPPFNGWSGQGGLWREVFGSSIKLRSLDTLDGDFGQTGPSFNPNGFNNGYSAGRYGGYRGGYASNSSNDGGSATARLLATLGTAQQRSTPPVSQIAWFLALYVFVLVPLNYSILRLIDRRELAWISIPLIVAAFSFFAYSYALSIRGKAILTRQVDIVQTSLGSKTARADSLLWLFSPRTTSYTLDSALPSAALADYATQEGVEQGTFSVIEPTETKAFKLQNAPVRIWVDRAFSAQSVPDLKTGLTRVGDRVQNGTPFDLEGAVWVQDRQTRKIGSLKSGGSAPIPAQATENLSGPDIVGGIERASGLETLFKGQVQQNGIPSAALRAALGDNYGQQNEGALLIGWSRKTVAPLSIGVSDAQQNDLTLWIVRAEAFQGARAGNKVAGREAIVTLVSSEPVPVAQRGATGGGTDNYECLLPNAKKWTLEARGLGGNAMPQQFGSPIPSSRRFRMQQRGGGAPIPVLPNGFASGLAAGLPAWVHFEVYDLKTGRWRALPGDLKRDNSPAAGWNFSARIGRELAREPDRLLKVRVRRDNDRARVSSLRVSSS